MEIIYCKHFPPRPCKAITLLKWIIVGKEAKERFTMVDYNHKSIHYAQKKELFYVGFYLLYVFEFLLALLYFRNCRKAIRNVSFEVEADMHQNEKEYLVHRKRFAWYDRFDW